MLAFTDEESGKITDEGEYFDGNITRVASILFSPFAYSTGVKQLFKVCWMQERNFLYLTDALFE